MSARVEVADAPKGAPREPTQGEVFAALLLEHAAEIAALNAQRAAAEASRPKRAPAPAPAFVPPAVHLREALDGRQPVPLCHARALDGVNWSLGGYTLNPTLVTCKRCLKSLAARGVIA